MRCRPRRRTGGCPPKPPSQTCVGVRRSILQVCGADLSDRAEAVLGDQFFGQGQVVGELFPPEGACRPLGRFIVRRTEAKRRSGRSILRTSGLAFLRRPWQSRAGVVGSPSILVSAKVAWAMKLTTSRPIRSMSSKGPLGCPKRRAPWCRCPRCWPHLWRRDPSPHAGSRPSSGWL